METALLPHSIVSLTVALGEMRHGRNAIALREALEKIPELRDEFWKRCAFLVKGKLQSIARTRRAHCRFSRIRRIDVHRRP